MRGSSNEPERSSIRDAPTMITLLARTEVHARRSRGGEGISRKSASAGRSVSMFTRQTSGSGNASGVVALSSRPMKRRNTRLIAVSMWPSRSLCGRSRGARPS